MSLCTIDQTTLRTGPTQAQRKAATLLAALIVSSCRFGGPSGDPTLPVFDGSAGVAGSSGRAGNTGSGGQGGVAGIGGAAGDAGSTSTGGSAGAPADAGDDIADDVAAEGGIGRDAWLDSGGDADVGSHGDSAAGDSADGDSVAGDSADGDSADAAQPPACFPPFSSAVCDPVCNVGCTPLLRCDITDTPRTGVCVGTLLSQATEGMSCTRTAVTDDCVERLSCIQGICRRLCYVDTDCTTSGTCCNMAIDVDAGPSGYHVCASCGP